MAKGFVIKCGECGTETAFKNGDSRFKEKLFISIHSFVEVGIKCFKCEELVRLSTED